MKAWRVMREGRGVGGRRKVDRIVVSVGAIVVDLDVQKSVVFDGL